MRIDRRKFLTNVATGMAVAPLGQPARAQANNSVDCQAVATAKYDEKPTYLAIIIGKPDLKVDKFPDDTKDLSISFADVGSTSGWLIPTHYAKKVWKINPKVPTSQL
jgi:ABC-type phosphate/phosphonate transport system substrate-binding protein